MLQLNFGPENRKRLKMSKTTEKLHGQSLLILCVGDMYSQIPYNEINQ